MNVRPARPSDQPEAMRLLLDAADEPRYRRWYEPDPACISDVVSEVVSQGGGLILENERGTVVGLAGFMTCRHHYSGERYLEELALFARPGYKRGVGLLLDRVPALSADLGVSLVRVTAPAGVASVSRMYQSRGFEPLETVYLRRV